MAVGHNPAGGCESVYPCGAGGDDEMCCRFYEAVCAFNAAVNCRQHFIAVGHGKRRVAGEGVESAFGCKQIIGRQQSTLGYAVKAVGDARGVVERAERVGHHGEEAVGETLRGRVGKA